MSVYQFAPAPNLTTHEETHATWTDAFSESQLSEIIKICEGLVLETATVGDNQLDEDIRVSDTSWISCNPQTQFIYDTLAWVARNLNGQFFDFDLYGFVEDFQYTVYRGNGGKYDWHLDRGPTRNGSAPRKLSMVLQLSDPSEYEGGDLEIFVGQNPKKIEKKKGLIVAFPSFVLHRVTPVTNGIRRTLVVWIAGPKFK